MSAQARCAVYCVSVTLLQPSVGRASFCCAWFCFATEILRWRTVLSLRSLIIRLPRVHRSRALQHLWDIVVLVHRNLIAADLSYDNLVCAWSIPVG